MEFESQVGEVGSPLVNREAREGPSEVFGLITTRFKESFSGGKGIGFHDVFLFTDSSF